MINVNVIDNKVAYTVAPKCGSRTVMAWCAIIRNPNLFSDHPEYFLSSKKGDPVYRRIRELVTNIEGKAKKSEWPIRFCVVRDPVERFISAYTNRILFHGKAPKMTVSELMNVLDSSDDNEEYKDIRNHTTTLVSAYGRKPEYFTHIFNINDMTDLRRLLEEQSGITLPELQLQQNGECVKPKLTETEISWIKNRYSEDYETYGNWMCKKNANI